MEFVYLCLILLVSSYLAFYLFSNDYNQNEKKERLRRSLILGAFVVAIKSMFGGEEFFLDSLFPFLIALGFLVGSYLVLDSYEQNSTKDK